MPYHYQLLENKFKFFTSKNLNYIANAGGKLDENVINALVDFCKKKKDLLFFNVRPNRGLTKNIIPTFKIFEVKT